ncbi:MAG: membrane protein insertase YidC [Treponema sp.]|nr:membrane protein insertase YidC [Treponema sp.]
MDKNTIWAIALSTLVIVVFMFLQTTVFAPQQPLPTEVTENTAKLDTATYISESTTAANQPAFIVTSDIEETIDEQTITITTDKVKAVFTNRGGDIISYELLEHIDTDTGNGVEMVDNVTAFNRACAVSFGDANSTIVDELFSVEQPDENTVLFTRRFDTFTFGKRYTFIPGEYLFKLEILVHSDAEAIALNTDGAAYTLRTSPQIGPRFDPKRNRYEMRQFISFNGEKKKTINVGTKQFKSYEREYIWAGIAGKYFEELVVPENTTNMTSEPYYSSQVEKGDYANAQAFFVRKPFFGTDMSDTYYLYFGPRNEKDLRSYNTSENNGWNLSNIRLTESMQTSGWLGWLENILKVILELLYKVVHNWGVAIIVMTILLKLAMFPLTKKQSMGTLKMQALQPRMTEIQERYKDNPQKMQMEMSKLYKENNYNPMSGCLPMVFQFLIIFAMYNLFNNYFEFRGASFIPGWISDLSAGDSVYTFKKDIPIISTFLGNAIRILPVIYLASQLFYGKITMVGGTATGSNAGQMKFMMYGMPLMFFFIFYNAPSGLLLYWTVSNLIQMGQQLIINKFMAQRKTELATQQDEKFVKNNKKRLARSK